MYRSGNATASPISDIPLMKRSCLISSKDIKIVVVAATMMRKLMPPCCNIKSFGGIEISIILARASRNITVFSFRAIYESVLECCGVTVYSTVTDRILDCREYLLGQLR